MRRDQEEAWHIPGQWEGLKTALDSKSVFRSWGPCACPWGGGWPEVAWGDAGLCLGRRRRRSSRSQHSLPTCLLRRRRRFQTQTATTSRRWTPGTSSSKASLHSLLLCRLPSGPNQRACWALGLSLDGAHPCPASRHCGAADRVNRFTSDFTDFHMCRIFHSSTWFILCLRELGVQGQPPHSCSLGALTPAPPWSTACLQRWPMSRDTSKTCICFSFYLYMCIQAHLPSPWLFSLQVLSEVMLSPRGASTTWHRGFRRHAWACP